MIFLILFFFLLTTIFLFWGIFQVVFIREQRVEKRLEHYLSVTNKKPAREQLNLQKKYLLVKKKIGKKMATTEKNTKLAIKLARSGLPYKAEEFLLFQWILTVVSGSVLFLLIGGWYFFLIGALFGYLFPKWYLSKKEKERIEHFNEGLTDMITTIIGSLRAGFSFPQALKTVVEESEQPIKDEMESVLKEMQYGSSLEDALNNLKDRMPSEDLDLMIQAIVIQRQVGGNLATVLEKIVETIRERTKIQMQIRTLTAQGRLSGIVVGSMPIILGFIIYLIQPDYMSAMFHNPIGIAMIVAGVISGTIGFLLIQKITKVEV